MYKSSPDQLTCMLIHSTFLLSQIYIYNCFSFFFSNAPATIEIYTLSLHDALPILEGVFDGQIGFPSASSTAPGSKPTRMFPRTSSTGIDPDGFRARASLPRISAAARGSFSMSLDRKSTRLNSSHRCISYAVFCLKK